MTDAGDASWSEREEKDRYDAELDLAEQARREETRERVWDVIDNNDPRPVDFSEDEFDHLFRERMEEDARRERGDGRPANTVNARADIPTPGTGSSGEIARLNAELRRRNQLPSGYYDDPLRVATDTPIGGAAAQPGGGAVTPPTTGSRVRPDAAQTARERATARPPEGGTSDLADRLVAHFVERGRLDAGLAERLKAASGGERAARRALPEAIRRTRFPLHTEPDELLAAWDRYARDAGMTATGGTATAGTATAGTATAAATAHNPTVVTSQPNDRGGTDYAINLGGSITPNGPEPITGTGDSTLESLTASGTGYVVEQGDTTEATATTDPLLGPNDRSVVANVAFGVTGKAAADITTGSLDATQDEQTIDLAGTAAAATGARGTLSIDAPTIDNTSVVGEAAVAASPPADPTLEGSGATLRVTPGSGGLTNERAPYVTRINTIPADQIEPVRRTLEPFDHGVETLLSAPDLNPDDRAEIEADQRRLLRELNEPRPDTWIVSHLLSKLTGRIVDDAFLDQLAGMLQGANLGPDGDRLADYIRDLRDTTVAAGNTTDGATAAELGNHSRDTLAKIDQALTAAGEPDTPVDGRRPSLAYRLGRLIARSEGPVNRWGTYLGNVTTIAKVVMSALTAVAVVLLMLLR